MKKLFLFLLILFFPLQIFAADIATLTDNFDDNSLDGAKWGYWADTGSIEETNQELQLSSTVDGANAGVYSASAYDLTGSQGTCKIVDAGNQSLSSWGLVFDIGINYNNDLLWVIEGGIIYAQYSVDGDFTIANSDTYVAATHKYLKIRESGGTIYWDYSADGLSWTNFASVSNPIAVTSVYPEWYIYAQSEASSTTAIVDDFNILPSASRRVIRVN